MSFYRLQTILIPENSLNRLNCINNVNIVNNNRDNINIDSESETNGIGENFLGSSSTPIPGIGNPFNSFSNLPLNSYPDSSLFTHKFLHLAPKTQKLSNLAYTITEHYNSLYPEDGEIIINKLQNINGFDLDLSYTVGQTFKQFDTIRVIYEKKYIIASDNRKRSQNSSLSPVSNKKRKISKSKNSLTPNNSNTEISFDFSNSEFSELALQRFLDDDKKKEGKEKTKALPVAANDHKEFLSSEKISPSDEEGEEESIINKNDKNIKKGNKDKENNGNDDDDDDESDTTDTDTTSASSQSNFFKSTKIQSSNNSLMNKNNKSQFKSVNKKNSSVSKNIANEKGNKSINNIEKKNKKNLFDFDDNDMTEEISFSFQRKSFPKENDSMINKETIIEESTSSSEEDELIAKNNVNNRLTSNNMSKNKFQSFNSSSAVGNNNNLNTNKQTNVFSQNFSNSKTSALEETKNDSNTKDLHTASLSDSELSGDGSLSFDDSTEISATLSKNSNLIAKDVANQRIISSNNFEREKAIHPSGSLSKRTDNSRELRSNAKLNNEKIFVENNKNVPTTSEKIKSAEVKSPQTVLNSINENEKGESGDVQTDTSYDNEAHSNSIKKVKMRVIKNRKTVKNNNKITSQQEKSDEQFTVRPRTSRLIELVASNLETQDNKENSDNSSDNDENEDLILGVPIKEQTLKNDKENKTNKSSKISSQKNNVSKKSKVTKPNENNIQPITKIKNSYSLRSKDKAQSIESDVDSFRISTQEMIDQIPGTQEMMSQPFKTQEIAAQFSETQEMIDQLPETQEPIGDIEQTMYYGTQISNVSSQELVEGTTSNFMKKTLTDQKEHSDIENFTEEIKGNHVDKSFKENSRVENLGKDSEEDDASESDSASIESSPEPIRKVRAVIPPSAPLKFGSKVNKGREAEVMNNGSIYDIPNSSSEEVNKIVGGSPNKKDKLSKKVVKPNNKEAQQVAKKKTSLNKQAPQFKSLRDLADLSAFDVHESLNKPVTLQSKFKGVNKEETNEKQPGMNRSLKADTENGNSDQNSTDDDDDEDEDDDSSSDSDEDSGNSKNGSGAIPADRLAGHEVPSSQKKKGNSGIRDLINKTLGW